MIYCNVLGYQPLRALGPALSILVGCAWGALFPVQSPQNPQPELQGVQQVSKSSHAEVGLIMRVCVQLVHPGRLQCH